MQDLAAGPRCSETRDPHVGKCRPCAASWNSCRQRSNAAPPNSFSPAFGGLMAFFTPGHCSSTAGVCVSLHTPGVARSAGSTAPQPGLPHQQQSGWCLPRASLTSAMSSKRAATAPSWQQVARRWADLWAGGGHTLLLGGHAVLAGVWLCAAAEDGLHLGRHSGGVLDACKTAHAICQEPHQPPPTSSWQALKASRLARHAVASSTPAVAPTHLHASGQRHLSTPPAFRPPQTAPWPCPRTAPPAVPAWQAPRRGSASPARPPGTCGAPGNPPTRRRAIQQGEEVRSRAAARSLGQAAARNRQQQVDPACPASVTPRAPTPCCLQGTHRFRLPKPTRAPYRSSSKPPCRHVTDHVVQPRGC